jgi:hypothetical protein
MKTPLTGKLTSRPSSRNCFVINQFATPGLGSIMGGRLRSGIGQLSLAVTGFGLVMVWFALTMIQYYGQITSDAPVKIHWGPALAGVVIFAFSWCWALVTSISLLRESKSDSMGGSELPPRITNPREKI